MKYRTIPAVYLFTAFPALAFTGSESGFSGSLDVLEIQPSAAGFVKKEVWPVDGRLTPKADKVKPAPVKSQTIELPARFKGISATVSRYEDGRQVLTFEESKVSPPALQQPELFTSDYDKLLLQVAVMIVQNGAQVWYNEKNGNFTLSFESYAPASQSMATFSIQIPSQIIADNDPEGVLPGFTMLSKTSLGDVFNAFHCYHNSATSHRPHIVGCDNDALLSAGSSKNSYNYFLNLRAYPREPLFSQFSEQPFGIYNGRFLSDEHLFLTYKGKPVKIAAIGDIQNAEELTDAGGERTGSGTQSDSQKGDSAPKNRKKDLSGKGDLPKKKRSTGGQDGDDPNEERPTDYGPKQPNDSTVGELKKYSTKVKNLEAAIDKIRSEINSLKVHIGNKWLQKKRTSESPNYERKMQELSSLEGKVTDLLAQLKQARQVPPARKEVLSKLPKAKDKDHRLTTNQLMQQVKEDWYIYEETEEAERQRQQKEYERDLHNSQIKDNKKQDQPDGEKQSAHPDPSHEEEVPKEPQEGITDQKSELNLQSNYEEDFPKLGH
ncbi:hypothetical protein GZ77_22720 [Endozoicomonas montiporae]|uniref:Uncharacterized protein n=2 Tax=Endozoicomonas montiporae TaxID=1027273 RepID=A0A081N0F2_9GAMM|nr:hypothetical protein [Endozoicomonas montiporae]AMO54381.1 hypothetical protein EZMO1_0109 [Endozoicomonas montiporae CL-33]KEQ11925.1 hypothetical protein GZ77_22720 [Endozoicomonas montiporae]